MKKFIVLLLLSCLFSCKIKVGHPKPTEDLAKLVQGLLEMAYFEGQKDAITGTIKIRKEGDKWKWIRSPWEDGSAPEFDPYTDINLLTNMDTESNIDIEELKTKNSINFKSGEEY